MTDEEIKKVLAGVASLINKFPDIDATLVDRNGKIFLSIHGKTKEGNDLAAVFSLIPYPRQDQVKIDVGGVGYYNNHKMHYNIDLGYMMNTAKVTSRSVFEWFFTHCYNK